MARKREARGRGNQGDWAGTSKMIGGLPQHAAHNAAVDAKKQARRKKRGQAA